MEYFNLNDGNRIPKIGFGTYKLNGSRGEIGRASCRERV